MDPEQYDIMSCAEDQHWWYLGMRDAMKRCLIHASMRLPRNPNVLDAGCGTGGNLRFINQLLHPTYLAGFDTSDQALAIASQKCPNAELYISDLRNPDIRHPTLDLIISCDVLYVTGVVESKQGLKMLARSLKPGGLFIWNLPAYNWLTSRHDQVVHTKERFTASALRELASELELECVRLSYRLCGLLPIVAIRRFAASFSTKGSPHASDLEQPHPWINSALLRVLKFENSLIAGGVSLPCGTSVFAVCRKL